MWPFLPKKCDCPETPTNQGTSCDHNGLTTNDLIYDGPNGVCSHVTTGMTATEAFQQLDYFICSVELTQYILDLIQNNPNLFPNFNTLVNGAINCNTINNCGPRPTTTTTSSSTSTTSTSTSTTSTSTSSTTTTTTTVAEACYAYDLTATINNASWTAQLCYGGVTSGVLPFIGNTFTTPCIINTSLVLNGINAVQTSFNCSTTTTTSSSTSTTSTTSTSTSSSTTTTTTTSAGYLYYRTQYGETTPYAGNGCILDLDQSCKLQHQNPNPAIVTSGDRVINSPGSGYFDGQDKTYRLQISTAILGDPSYVVTIDNLGYVNIISVCT